MIILVAMVLDPDCVSVHKNYIDLNQIAKQRVDEILKALKSDNEMIQLEAVTELCNFFSVSTQDSVQSARVELFIPHLVTLLRKFDNVQLSRK